MCVISHDGTNSNSITENEFNSSYEIVHEIQYLCNLYSANNYTSDHSTVPWLSAYRMYTILKRFWLNRSIYTIIISSALPGLFRVMLTLHYPVRLVCT